MLKNYFKVALRNILKYRFFSAINILGMTIGITSCLLIILFISNELSFDRFHKDAERIYAVGLHGKLGGQDIMAANTCPPMAAALVADIPEIESATRLYRNGAMTVRLGDKTFTEKKILYADSNFFEFFTFPILAGDPKSALKEPNSIVLTKDAVVKYFAEEDPLGKILTLGDDKKAYKVTGVLPNTPPNSSIQFTMLLSASSSTDLKTTQWLNNFMYNYFKIRPNTHVEDVTKKFEGLTEKYVGPEVEKFMGTTIKQLKASGGDYGYYAVKITDLHLASPSTGDLEPGGDITYIYFFGGIGIFIVLIACINFMNLSTARSAGRAKEVGLRKTLGGLRGQMIAQFLSESLIYSLAALILSLVTCYFLVSQAAKEVRALHPAPVVLFDGSPMNTCRPGKF